MLRPEHGIERVYLHRAPVDMRKQIDGLAILARDVIKEDLDLPRFGGRLVISTDLRLGTDDAPSWFGVSMCSSGRCSFLRSS